MKRLEKRVISVVLILAMLATMVRMSPAQDKVAYAAISGGDRVRGAVNSITELPQYGRADYQTLEKGARERPFVVLEIVPYKEYAEIGYLIGGCEPIDLTYQRNTDLMGGVVGLNSAYLKGGDTKFFTWEPEAQDGMFDAWNADLLESGEVNGFFERVASGGQFREVYEYVEATPQAAPKGIIAPLNGPGSLSVPNPAPASEGTAAPEGTPVSGNTPAPESTPASEGTPVSGSTPAPENAPVSGSTPASGNTPASESTAAPENAAQGNTSLESASSEAGKSLVLMLEQTGTPQGSAPGNSEPSSPGSEPESSDTPSPGSDPESSSTPSPGSAPEGSGTPSPESAPGSNGTPSPESAPEGNGTPSPESAPEGSGTPSPENLLPGNSLLSNPPPPQNNTSEGDVSGGNVSGNDVSDGDVSGGDERPKMLQVKLERVSPGDADGTLVWHTVNEAERADLYPGVDFSAYDKSSQDFAKALQGLSVGGRIYTTLACDSENPMKHSNSYQYYRNQEYFLRLALGLSAQAASTYSIVVKTITPEELNQTPAWVDYADLFYLSPQSHVAGLPDLYAKYNNTSVPTGKGFDPAMGMKDLSWEVVERIYRRITAQTNFAAIVLDDAIATDVVGCIKTTDNVPAAVYDFNLEKTSWMPQNLSVSACNVYKLWVMLCSMDQNLFQKLYLNGSDPLIQNGVFRLRSGEVSKGVSLDTAWGIGTFSLVKPGNENANAPWVYWYKEEAWNNYHMMANPTTAPYRYWCDGRVFTYSGDTTMLQGFAGGILGTNRDKYKDLYEFLDGHLTEEEKQKIIPAYALRYILSGENKSSSAFGQGITLNILDLEPSVGLNEDNTPKWYLKESYVRFLLPKFAGEIQIVHQTTAEFIGKAEDLNDVYDMVFVGQDVSGYNLSNGSTVWNDYTMNGKIYFHTGDSVQSGEFSDTFGGTRTAKWVSSQYGLNLGNAKDKPGSTVNLRFPGNDISRIKKGELEDFLRSGRPIVVESSLDKLDPSKIDAASYLYQLVKTQKEAGGLLYGVGQVEQIENAMQGVMEDQVVFTGLPALYDGTTNPGTSVIANPNYLPIDGGRAYLQFDFTVSQPGYYYRMYVDQDHNGKFEQVEVLSAGAAKEGENTLKFRIAASMLGLVQWKIEVYRGDNESVRYVETGCSAVQPSPNIGKRQIKVLQIIEDRTTYNQEVILANRGNRFEKYYSNLDNYNIAVDSITWKEYSACFKDARFSYDHSKAIDTENPVSGNPVNLNRLKPISGGGTANGKNLNDYNMIIIGPGGAKQYSAVTMSNAQGEVDFLYYFADSGRVMLFTHDLSSMYNQTSGGFSNPFGYTVNTLMRDLMGMNRYGSVNQNISTSDQKRLSDYQNAHASNYDVTDSAATHGYTYGAIKRMGATNVGARMPYQALSASKGSRYTFDGAKNNTDDDGVTNKVAKINEGPITSYPYKIDDVFQIAETNVQYYQLNPEDPEVTVWYCLDRRTDESWNSAGSTLFAVSPKDAMNNYYVYSKDNIFYSGVGHSNTVTDMEAKLFVNTMITAYNVTLEPPVIEVTNPEAVLSGSNEYSIELIENFDEISQGYYTVAGESAFGSADVYTVSFTPVDFNLVSTQLSCAIQLGEGVYADTIYQVVNGVKRELHADGEHWFTGLQNSQTYYLDYPKESIISQGEIVFTVKNNKIKSTTDTTLHMAFQPLFPLD